MLAIAFSQQPAKIVIVRGELRDNLQKPVFWTYGESPESVNSC